MTLDNFLNIVEIGVLLFTAFIVWRYTQETKRLREATETQTKFNIEPQLSLVEIEGAVALANKSGGVAKDISLRSSEKPEEFDFVYIDAIAPGENIKIEFRTGPNSKEFFFPNELLNWLIIDYKDALGNKKRKKFRRADFGHGFTENDREACDDMPGWAIREYYIKS